MTVKIMPRKLSGSISAICSKSDAHRVLIAAALADKPTKIIMNTTSVDIEATINCLESLGAEITRTGNEVLVVPIEKKRDSSLLDCCESGSTLRFLLPLCTVFSNNVTITGEGRLPFRPVSPLREEMEKNGVAFSKEGVFPIELNGSLKSGVFTLSGKVSSQFITGLLFTLPLLEGDSKIELTSELESKPYVDMTIKTLGDFGVCVEETDNGYHIKGGQRYVSPSQIVVEADWSNAAFFVCAAALGSDISIGGLSLNSLQGDKAVLDLLKTMGVQTLEDNDRITVVPMGEKKLLSAKIDMSQTPDLLPILAVVCACADGKSELFNAARVRIKECDRVLAMREVLEKALCKVLEGDDFLAIWGCDRLEGGEFDSYNDHRMVMALAIMATVSQNPITITNAQAVNKSYPEFFEDYKKLGGEVYVINDGEKS